MMANVNNHFSEREANTLDFLLVGQGLAGTLLAHFLLLENQRIKVIDTPLPGATSGIAAGIVNPVTGRRFAKSWRFEELRPFAKETYRSLENLLGIPIWHDRNILRALPTVLDENEWLRRSGFPDYEQYFQEPADLDGYLGKVKPVRAWGELRQAAQVAMPDLVAAFRNFLQERGLLMEEVFDYQQVEPGEGRVGYQDFSAKKIIFCEGARAIDNPFFNYLPFSVTKGELLLVRIPGARFEKMLKHHVMISAFGKPEDEIFWVGSTSRFEFEGTEPTAEKRQWLEE
ncbi:MAG: FAD-dependent oxidoreductase, partial [Bacteroidota bacterium]